MTKKKNSQVQVKDDEMIVDGSNVEEGKKEQDNKQEEVVVALEEAGKFEKEAVGSTALLETGEGEGKSEEIKEDIDRAVNEEKKAEGLKILKQTGQRGWYVIHSYAGYEDQVAENLKQRIDTLKMQDKIFTVVVPKEQQIEIKNGKRRTVERRIFPGYVMVEMLMDDDSWYVVRNTPNVTGFIGMGVRPTPMLPEEVERIKKRMGVKESRYKIEFKPDDLIRIVDGPLKGFEGKVTDIDEDRGKVKVSVSMFGRETPVSLDSLQVKKV